MKHPDMLKISWYHGPKVSPAKQSLRYVQETCSATAPSPGLTTCAGMERHWRTTAGLIGLLFSTIDFRRIPSHLTGYSVAAFEPPHRFQSHLTPVAPCLDGHQRHPLYEPILPIHSRDGLSSTQGYTAIRSMGVFSNAFGSRPLFMLIDRE